MPRNRRETMPNGDTFRSDRRVNFLGASLDTYTMAETVAIARDAMEQRNILQHVVVNVAKLVNMRNDPDLKRDVEESDLINIDGMGVLWGCRLLGLPVTERVAGIDLMSNLLALCENDGFRPFFFGAKQEVLEKAVDIIRARHPKIDIAGYRNGYFGPDDEAQIANEIKAAKADCLFIAISSPTKEYFLHKYRNDLDVAFLMGVGGSIDVIAGAVNRAPEWMQKYGLEWLYRVYQEPRRMWRRYLYTNGQYALLLGKALVKKILTRAPAT